MKSLNKRLITQIGKIDGWMENNEIQALYEIAYASASESEPHEAIVEIGSWKGKSTVILALACKYANKISVVAIDPCKNTSAHRYLGQPDTLQQLKSNLTRFNVAKNVRIITKTSREAFSDYTGATRLLFIDGDHSYTHVFFDVTHWEKTLIYNGYLLLHDTINHEGPRRMLFSLLRNPGYTYAGTYKDLSIFKKVKVLTPKNWCKKIFSYIVFKAFFKIYTPAVS